MPILTIQRRMRELGRIRIGQQVPTGSSGKRRPAKLDTFRLTSESRPLIDAAAAVYGGTVSAWKSPTGDQWEVVTTRASIPIVVPPGEPVSQWYELWSGGGCLRRCNGETMILDMTPCACPGDVDERIEAAKRGEACSATTRLSVMLPELPDLGVWRLESHGFYAASELAGAAEILAMASASGRLIPANLRLEQREKRVPGKPTNKYAVPIIEFVQTTAADMGIVAALPEAGRAAIAAGTTATATGSAAPALPSTTLPPVSPLRAPEPVAEPAVGVLAASGPGSTSVTTAEPAPPPAGPTQAPATAEPDPEPAEPTEAPSAAIWTDPETGEPIEVVDGSATVVDPEPETPAPAMTHDELKVALAELAISAPYAVERSRQLYPRPQGTPLTDEQRAGLVLVLRAEAEAAEGATA